MNIKDAQYLTFSAKCDDRFNYVLTDYRGRVLARVEEGYPPPGLNDGCETIRLRIDVQTGCIDGWKDMWKKMEENITDHWTSTDD